MNSDKLNALIKKRANGNNDISLHLHQMFFFEHVLMRLEKSKYKDNIILRWCITFFNYRKRYENHKRYRCHFKKYSS